MRVLFFLILLFPAAGFAGSYNYDKIISLNKGSDNFAFDKVKTTETAGEIVLDESTLVIDGKLFDIKSSEGRNVYKSKNCSFELVYKGEELAAVKVFKSNSVVCYFIKTEQPTLVTQK